LGVLTGHHAIDKEVVRVFVEFFFSCWSGIGFFLFYIFLMNSLLDA
jgi:hypothetical protein